MCKGIALGIFKWVFRIPFIQRFTQSRDDDNDLGWIQLFFGSFFFFNHIFLTIFTCKILYVCVRTWDGCCRWNVKTLKMKLTFDSWQSLTSPKKRKKRKRNETKNKNGDALCHRNNKVYFFLSSCVFASVWVCEQFSWLDSSFRFFPLSSYSLVFFPLDFHIILLVDVKMFVLQSIWHCIFCLARAATCGWLLEQKKIPATMKWWKFVIKLKVRDVSGSGDTIEIMCIQVEERWRNFERTEDGTNRTQIELILRKKLFQLQSLDLLRSQTRDHCIEWINCDLRPSENKKNHLHFFPFAVLECNTRYIVCMCVCASIELSL